MRGVEEMRGFGQMGYAIPASDHEVGMNDRYFVEGQNRAATLDNRGTLILDDDGRLDEQILDAYWRCGFYVFERALSSTERDELVSDFEALLDRLPRDRESKVDRQGRPAAGLGFTMPSFRFAKPLSDPYGGSGLTGGRYESKMTELKPPEGAPEEVLLNVSGCLQLMDACLRLYGHPQLLRVAEAINGPDFTPFTDNIWVKQAGLGPSVAWHQDGTTHWDNPDLDRGTHGFNFMVQLYDTPPENALWVVPGSHARGKIDIKKKVEENGSDQLPDAVPMLMKAGDVAICNRQVLHGSFANASAAKRATFVFGFHRRSSVLGAQGWAKNPYDEDYVTTRCRIIPIAVDARSQHFEDEDRYVYEPLRHESHRHSTETRKELIANYNLNDIGL